MDCISMFVHITKENDSRVTLSKERLNLNRDCQNTHTTSYGFGDTGSGLGQVQTANTGNYQHFGK